MIPWTVRKAMASDVPRLFVALQMYVPWLSPVAEEITKMPSLLLFSGLFPSRSHTNDGDGLPALTTHLKITDSPVAVVRFVVGVISISGGTFTKEQRSTIAYGKLQGEFLNHCITHYLISRNCFAWNSLHKRHEICRNNFGYIYNANISCTDTSGSTYPCFLFKIFQCHSHTLRKGKQTSLILNHGWDSGKFTVHWRNLKQKTKSKCYRNNTTLLPVEKREWKSKRTAL